MRRRSWKTGARPRACALPPEPLRWAPDPARRRRRRLHRRPAHAGRQRRCRGADRHRPRTSTSRAARWSAAPSSTPTARCCSCRSRAACVITTEMGVLDVKPGEIALVPRGVVFKVDAARRRVARLRLRELRRAVPPARAGPDRLQRPGQRARLPGAGRRLRGRRAAATNSSRSPAAASGARRRSTRPSTSSPGTATSRR